MDGIDDEAKPVVIDIPKARKCVNIFTKCLAKEIHINKYLKRCMTKCYGIPTREVSFQKESLFYDIPLKLKHFKRDKLLVPLEVYLKTQYQDKRKQKRGIKYNEKLKIISTVLQKRRHVENPPDDIIAVIDADEGFYRYVNGRPIRDRAPLFKSLKYALADLLRLKAEIGIRNDAILQIEANRKKELEMYDNSLKRFTIQAKSFESFISEDYQKSKDFLEKCDNLKTLLNIKLTELQNIATAEFTITSRLMGLDYLYGMQQKYGRFLYYLSPPSWRSKNREFARSVEIEAKGFDLSPSEEETFNVVFDKMQKACFGDLVKPVMYFTQPYTLMDIFERDEEQQLHNFIYVTNLAPRRKVVKDSIARLKEKINQESALLESTIKILQKDLEFSEERCVHLETKFFKIINGLFYESVGAPEVLKLFVHLEFAYERMYVEKPISPDLVTMARSIENFHMEYSKLLDALHSKMIKLSVAKCLEKERCKMIKARRAARELHLFEVLKRELLRAYEPVCPYAQSSVAGKNPKLRKSLNRELCHKKVDPKKSLTESEIEYLTLFTDWTEGDDPYKYLHKQDHE